MYDHPMPAVHKLTVNELWALFPDETHVRHELIDGVHFATPTPIPRHQLLVGRLSFEIELYLRAHPGVGQLFGVPLDCVLSDHDVVEPDLILIAEDQMEILTDKNVQGAPALVIEVLSPSTRRRDLGIKRQLFDRAGVREYWIVDGKRNRMEIHRRNAGGILAPAGELRAAAGDVLTTPLLPGLELPLGPLFR
ncbi:MAG: Uma2 family endonuclease [Acidobacteriota bacterium]|nr:Uma2 family endonuclease [Acidobacteriota bacterium]